MALLPRVTWRPIEQCYEVWESKESIGIWKLKMRRITYVSSSTHP